MLCECDRNEEHLFTCPLYLDIREKRMNDTCQNAVMAFFENVLSSKNKTCLDWPSLFPMRLRQETSLQGQASFTM